MSEGKEDKRIHLSFIQNIISRMGQNSFYLKGWSLTLVAALFALSNSEANKAFALVTYFPIFVFWLLDGHFLSLERKYRSLYDAVASGVVLSDAFSLDVNALPCSSKCSLMSCLLSKPIVVYYGSMLSITIFIMFGVL